MTRKEAITILKAAGLPNPLILTERHSVGTDYAIADRTIDPRAALTGYKGTLLGAVVAGIRVKPIAPTSGSPTGGEAL